VLGFAGTPEAGDRLAVVDDEARAREVTDYRTGNGRAASARTARGSLEQMMINSSRGTQGVSAGDQGDVQGSVEAIVGRWKSSGPTRSARASCSGVGGLPNPTSRSPPPRPAIIGFNVPPTRKRAPPPAVGVEIRYYNIIYDLSRREKKAMSACFATLRETMLGNAEILEIFDVSKVGKIAASGSPTARSSAAPMCG